MTRYPNEWVHLCHMSNQKMFAMYRADYLSKKAIEFLHNLRINDQQSVTADQADWLMRIQDSVNTFDAYHQHDYGTYDVIADDDIEEMLTALGKPRFDSSWRKI